MPTSTTATSTGASANAANAIAGDHLELAHRRPVRQAGCGLLSTSLHERFDLAVGLHVARGADRLAVDRDALDGRLQVRAGGAAGAPAEARSAARRPSGPPTSCRWCPAMWIARVAALRRAQQLHQRRDAGGARLDLGLRPALVQQVLHLKQRRDLVRCRSGRFGSQSMPSCRPASRAVIRSTSSPATCWRARILATTSSGALARNASLPSLAAGHASSFCAAARSFSSRRRSAATSTVPEVSSSTSTVPRDSRTSTDAVGVNPSLGVGQPRQRRHGGDLAVQVGLVDADSRAGTPAGRRALVAAEPADLGDQLLHVGDALGGNGIQRDTRTAAGHSAITTDSPAGQRLPQRLGDERHHRVQQPQQRVEHRGQHRGGVLVRPLGTAAPWPVPGTSRRTRPTRSGRAPRRPG